MKFLLILMSIFILFPVKSEEYTINVLDLLKDDKSTTHLIQYYTHIYQAVDITPSFTFYPSKRGLKMVNDGELDAEAFRLDVVGEHFKQLIKVNESIGELQIGFFCLEKRECKIDGTSIIGVLSTFRGAVDFCAESNINCNFVKNVTSIAKKLDTGLVDAIFATDIEAQKIICASNFNNFHFLPSMASNLPLYHYINKRHINLKKDLEKSILNAKNEGKIAINSSKEKLTNLNCEKTVSFITL